MSIKKEKAFSQLEKDFNTCSSLVLGQLRLLENIIKTGGIEIEEEIIEKVLSNEKDINKLEVKISNGVVNSIVLYSPVASDLRLLMAYYRLSINLERIADLMLNSVNHIKRIKDLPLYSSYAGEIKEILSISINMVEKSLLSFVNDDLEYAVWIIENDDVVDELNHSFIAKVMGKDTPKIKSQSVLSTYISMKSIVSNIERIADNATNIAEAAIYSIEGKDVRHKRIEKIKKDTNV